MSDVGEIQLDDQPVVSGDCMVPLAGNWHSDLSTVAGDKQFSVGQSVTLTIAGVSRKGTVVIGSAPDLRPVLRVVGGKGKLNTVLPAQEYDGRNLAYVLTDVLQSAGEDVGDVSLLQSVNLPKWNRPAVAARNTLRRLERLAPAGVFVRMGSDGKWTAVRPTWAPVGAALDLQRMESFPAENAMAFYGIKGCTPEPGTSLSIFNSSLKIDRTYYEWGGETLGVLCWYRDDRSGDQQLDRMRTTVRRWFADAMREARAEVDFGQLYRGKVGVVGGSNGKVDCIFEDDLGRLKFASGCALRRSPGETVTVQAGTRVLVGWADGDERFPFALLDSSDGGGGLLTLLREATAKIGLKAPLVGLGDDPDNLAEAAVLGTTFSGLMHALSEAIKAYVQAPLVPANISAVVTACTAMSSTPYTSNDVKLK